MKDRDTKISNLGEFKENYKTAPIKFIWDYKTIEEYIPTIHYAIQDTFKDGFIDIDKKDISTITITDKAGKELYFAIYFDSRSQGKRGSIYSVFRFYFKKITSGLTVNQNGRQTPDDKEIFIDRWISQGSSQEEAEAYWREMQALKRKIINFNTIANRSLNRTRKVSTKLRFEVLRRDGFKCIYCGSSQYDGVKLHVDHFTPVVKGGKNEIDYLVTSCESCNLGKGASDPNDWFNR